ncbi:ABC transporter ATP-binding protein [Mesorhizobium sp.]|uniref:ABC transporter ATP-binding protein n=1 Tax=Mesorhizobium sp. TaxID=1871066 RepID=UPI000FE42886|nr:ABC transporter ATP-binding protein [Mesorhizobium sp.]RWN51492.1 MAG: ABC transporter ATP-binding protein [Mesorhizobium sp.]RWN72204.1 MAG: ABC transporter ATP-binding protein [Mesorhizobium sp.]RWN73408.1 MAG: ABC transporter ATP-binding protein [Mesorhizobium sp.]RWN85719.1 MAG: ABC transporter ATP-binding protein [Mesorhizobium sp.]RWO09471.1 MAG: ABC transporter ATP-binding protein [Mesorhizobium sp.]
MNIQQRNLRATTGRVEAEHVSIRLGGGSTAFDAVSDVSFDISPGEFVCLLGPSGCGKSTLLGALAGHITPLSGRLSLDGLPVKGPHPERGIVFQHHTLFPWKSARRNVAFGPKMRGIGRAEREREADRMLDLVGLNGFVDRYPGQLSGGMQQRVEIARVLINQPRLLLMDEPFGALDALTRLRMQELLLEVWEQFRTTIVFVTHDIDEALLLADRIIVMQAQPGRIHEEITVAFKRPRTTDIIASREFLRLKQRFLQLLRSDRRGDTLPRLSPLG